MQMMSESDLTREEQDTLRKAQESTTHITVSGAINTTEEATVYVAQLDTLVTVQLRKESPKERLSPYARNSPYQNKKNKDTSGRVLRP